MPADDSIISGNEIASVYGDDAIGGTVLIILIVIAISNKPGEKECDVCGLPFKGAEAVARAGSRLILCVPH